MDLGGAQLGLGDTVDTVQRSLVDTDVFADHFWRDARVAQAQSQRVRQRELPKCALVGSEFISHLTSVPCPCRDEASSAVLYFLANLRPPLTRYRRVVN